jgi:hypothetical protein
MAMAEVNIATVQAGNGVPNGRDDNSVCNIYLPASLNWL